MACFFTLINNIVANFYNYDKTDIIMMRNLLF
jgi:hypothetical protein